LLFVLTMEYFSRMMTLASSLSHFSFHPGSRAQSLQHLMFVDDFFIFYKADPPTLQIIMQTLRDFYCYFGLQANPTKSQVVFGGCADDIQLECINITSFQEG